LGPGDALVRYRPDRAEVFYKRKAIEQTALPHGILVQPIPATVFGMVDGEALFLQILDAIRARDEAKAKKD
jgi:hypothetical protein